MREIKFRAWDKTNKILLPVVDINWIEQAIDFITVWDEGLATGYTLDSHDNDFEVMQYIGRKDKHNKEIYEGDVVIFALPNNQWSDGQEVKFYRGSFVTRSGGIFSLGFLAGAENLPLIEVIGNKWENPELLEVK